MACKKNNEQVITIMSREDKILWHLLVSAAYNSTIPVMTARTCLVLAAT